MNDPAVVALSKLQSVLKSLDTSLSHLAAVGRAKVLYADGEFRELVARYRSLRAADLAARRGLKTALPKDVMSYDQRIKTYGEAEARRQFAPFGKALEAKVEAGRAVAAFEDEHPLISQLVLGAKAPAAESDETRHHIDPTRLRDGDAPCLQQVAGSR